MAYRVAIDGLPICGDPDELLTLGALARRAGKTRATAYRWAERDDFPAPAAARLVGDRHARRGSVEWRLADVLDWWDGRTPQSRARGYRGPRNVADLYHCPTCGEDLAQRDFYPKRSGNGLSRHCRKCEYQHQRERRLARATAASDLYSGMPLPPPADPTEHDPPPPADPIVDRDAMDGWERLAEAARSA